MNFNLLQLSDESLQVLARLVVDRQLCGLILRGHTKLARRVLTANPGEPIAMTDDEIAAYTKQPILNFVDSPAKALKFEFE